MTDKQTLELDPEQEAAASIDPAQRQVVLAPPGSGKTEVVAALIERLTEDHGLSPADELLAVSFSRAAVSALRRRVPAGRSQPSVSVRTLDSLASRLLDELEDGEWRQLAFDARIERAGRLLSEGADSEEFRLLRHLIVDEVQDLVGVRAELVLQLLERLPEGAGFTLLGDPRQAVFNFQLRNEADMTSEALLRRVDELGDVERRELSHQYRARSKEAKRAWALSVKDGSGDAWIRDVRAFTSKIFMAGDIEALASPLRRWPGSTVFLCRTNGEALLVASGLRGLGIPAGLRAPAEELPVDPWLGEAFQSERHDSLSRERAMELLSRTASMGKEDAWRLLKTVERDYRITDRLNLRKLAVRIAARDVPAELLVEAGNVLVSTIHRAKGLEFDNVVLVNPGDLLPGGAEVEDASVAYVALTRARDQIIGVRCDVPRGLRMNGATRRWIIAGHQSWQTFGFEVRGSDTRSDPEALNAVPSTSMVPGTPVVARLDPERSSLEVPVYALFVDDVQVARTTVAFGETLARRIGRITGRRTTWPVLEGLTVDTLETVAWPEPEDSARGVLSRGVRVGGLAKLDWGSRR